MRKKIIFSILGGVVVLAITLYVVLTCYQHHTSIGEIRERAKGNVNITLSELTDFKWERAYIAAGYSSNEHIESKTGIKNNLEDLQADYQRRIVFINDNKIVYDYIYITDSLLINAEESFVYPNTLFKCTWEYDDAFEEGKRAVLNVYQIENRKD